MDRRVLRVLGLFSLVFISLATVSNARAQWGIYFSGSTGDLRVPNTNRVYGSTFGFYKEKEAGPVTLGADFRGSLQGSGNAQGSFSDERLDSGLIGVRAAATPLQGRWMPYMEGLAGKGYFREGVGISREDQSSGSLEALGGLDFRVFGRWQWRVAEISYNRVRGELYTVHPVTISSGIVIQLP